VYVEDTYKVSSKLQLVRHKLITNSYYVTSSINHYVGDNVQNECMNMLGVR